MTASEYLASQPPVTRRLFALLVLMFMGIAAWQVFILPVARLVLSQDNWRTTAIRELSYKRGLIATEHQARDQQQALRAASIWQRLFQEGSLGSAEQLKAEVAQVLNASGAVAVNLTSLPPESQGGLRRYGVRVVATLDAGQLKHFLDGLRARPHYLRVEQLALTAPLLQSPDDNPPLQLKGEIFGYAIAPGRRGSR